MSAKIPPRRVFNPKEHMTQPMDQPKQAPEHRPEAYHDQDSDTDIDDDLLRQLDEAMTISEPKEEITPAQAILKYKL